MITIAIIVAAFIAGAITCAIVLLRAGIAREESDGSILGQPATRASAVTRRIVGMRPPARIR